MLTCSSLMTAMKRKAGRVLRKYADRDPSVETATAMYREFNAFIQPIQDQGYIYHYNATFHMFLEDGDVERYCKMELQMTEGDGVFLFTAELNTPEDPSVAYDRAMKVL